jgi:integrase
MEGSYVHKVFKQLLRQAELPDVRFHDLRHSVATVMLKMGVHPKQVQELLGHSQIAITMDLYSWVLPSMQRELMDQVDEIFRDL